MIAIVVRPKSKVVSRAAVFQDMDSFKTFCEDNGLSAHSFDISDLSINEKKFYNLPKFEGEISQKGWL